MLQKLDPGSYFGVTSHLYARAGLSVSETGFPAECDIPLHEHTNAFFCLVLEGQGTRSWHARSGAERDMSLTVFPSEVPHANHWYGTGGRVMHVEFASSWLERVRGVSAVLDRPADFDKGPPIWLARRLIDECREQDDVSALVIEGLVMELLGECTRARPGSLSSSKPHWLLRAQRLIEDRFTDKLTLIEIAAACEVSADHLARAFRQHYGCTVGEYMRKLRVEYACRRLAESDAALADIALAAGFTDQSHFSRVFQGHMRVSPGAFRVCQRGSRFRTKG